nr:hypothetical protein [Tanacetum cinerariifolium]
MFETQGMDGFCTNLSNKVLELESEVIDIKYTYQERIEKLEGRVERLEEKNRVLKELKKEPAYVEEVLEVVKAAKLMTEVVTTTGATKVSVSRKRGGVIIQDPEETTTTATVQPKVQAKDKGKAIPIEESKPLKRKAQIELDEEVARQLQEELNADINWNKFYLIDMLHEDELMHPEETTTTATVQPKVQAKDKGKAIPIEESKPLKRKAQIELDEGVARQLQEELNADINWNKFYLIDMLHEDELMRKHL